MQVRELQKHLCLGTGRLLQLPLGLRDHSHNLAGTSALDQRRVHDRQFFHTFTLCYSCCTSDHSQNFHFLNLEPCLHLWLLRCQRFWIAGSSRKRNIAKGTADPRVEFSFTKVTCLGHITSSRKNLVQISSSESRPSISFEI